jgi:coenzyme F420-reducing hydrogenase beta subunit
VLAETADVTVGDAWLPEYIKDGLGTNIITIRSPEILAIFEIVKTKYIFKKWVPKRSISLNQVDFAIEEKGSHIGFI